MLKFDCFSVFLLGIFLLLCGSRRFIPPPQTYQLIELNRNNCLNYRPELIYKSPIHDQKQNEPPLKFTSIECQWSNTVSCKDELHSTVNRQVNQILPILPLQTRILYKLKNGTYGILQTEDSSFHAFRNQSQFLHLYSRFLKNETACF